MSNSTHCLIAHLLRSIATMGNVSPTPRQLLTESVIFWSIAIVLYVGRMISRVISNGSVKRLYFDDYVMSATFVGVYRLLVLNRKRLTCQ
jgi:hypothetical protein